MTSRRFDGSLRSLVGAAALAAAFVLPATARAEAAPTVRVHVLSPRPAVLQRRAAGPGAWEAACASPCDLELPTAAEYRVVFDGNENEAGQPFRLDPSLGGDVTVKARPASSGAKAAGTVIVVVGSTLTAASFMVFVWSAAAVLGAPRCGDGSGDWCGLGEAIGKAFMLVSGAGMLAGTGIILGGVSVLSDARASAAQRPGAVREPTWSAPRVEAPSKAAFVTPLSFSF